MKCVLGAIWKPFRKGEKALPKPNAAVHGTNGIKYKNTERRQAVTYPFIYVKYCYHEKVQLKLHIYNFEDNRFISTLGILVLVRQQLIGLVVNYGISNTIVLEIPSFTTEPTTVLCRYKTRSIFTQILTKDIP